MIEEETTGGLDFCALSSAIECGDPDALLGFYSEDAELRIVNAALPEGPPFELRGRVQIERYLRAVCDQQMTWLVEGEVVIGEGSIAFGRDLRVPGRGPDLRQDDSRDSRGQDLAPTRRGGTAAMTTRSGGKRYDVEEHETASRQWTTTERVRGQ